jgi:hypothetical protein
MLFLKPKIDILSQKEYNYIYDQGRIIRLYKKRDKRTVPVSLMNLILREYLL